MAKRTPRTEADDTTNTAAAPRQPQPSTGGARPESAEGRAKATATPIDSDERNTSSEGQSDPLGFQPSEEEIRYRAYLLYIERGGEHGMDFEDWLQAERELKSKQ